MALETKSCNNKRINNKFRKYFLHAEHEMTFAILKTTRAL